MSKDFRVLKHKRVYTPVKFWGAGPVPKGMHRQIDESLSNISDNEQSNNDDQLNDDDNVDDELNDDNDVDDESNDDEQVESNDDKSNSNNQSNDKDEQSTQIVEQPNRSKNTTPKRSAPALDGERKTKRAKLGGFGPEISDMNEENVNSPRYSFYNYKGQFTVQDKSCQVYGRTKPF